MTDILNRRIEEIEVAIEATSGAHRESLMRELERVVAELEAQGGKASSSAQARLDAECEDRVEENFDNMPI
ncbi:hypothetical protein [Salipiger mucosus]|uniref:Uncharacterized protein n=1 Tax=Salipiger mucosus DSM 16094 TaxID=1123237 RepID=S9R128_9RHOB|nr:hypothetical protein [Salipiger mucosus]EPX85628.1 hypothetical protein Salmuc_04899 [Salipiger mucosus DSM 16094]